jgi:hypothetical protein
MKKKKWVIMLGVLLIVPMLVSVAYALPVLPVNEITKMKFENWEDWIDVNNTGMIDAGDYFTGILRITTITGMTSNDITYSSSNVNELTGDFQISVVGGSIAPVPGSVGHLDFDLLGTDHFTVYYDDSADFSSTNIATAIDGVKWMEVVAGGSFYEGINDTIVSPFSASVNKNWMNLDTNATGYPIIPMPWSSTAGIDPIHTYLGNVHGDHIVDMYFESKLQNIMPGGNPAIGGPGGGLWDYLSEDPVYLYAVPEPATMLLLGSGLIGLAGAARRKKKLQSKKV